MIGVLFLAVLVVVAIVAVTVADSRSPRREGCHAVTAPEHRNRGPPAL
jgi:hypothetical protein